MTGEEVSISGIYTSYIVMEKKTGIYRIIDANLNRLREALRVIEEYYRFIDNRPAICVKLKKVRHSLIEAEKAVGKERLLSERDTVTDCFAGGSRPEERKRQDSAALLAANFKRGQEAGRVLEEYAKIQGGAIVSDRAKAARFALYELEKDLLSGKKKARERRGRK
jgi:thiamine-phosphate pyrophosphorylase